MARVAEEWARQGETVDPADMPLTRLLNSAIDGVARTMEETRAEIARYAGSDLLCYRAEAPGVARRAAAAAFDPVLDWAAEALGARFCWRPASCMSSSRPRRWRRSAPRSTRSTIRRRWPRSA